MQLTRIAWPWKKNNRAKSNSFLNGLFEVPRKKASIYLTSRKKRIGKIEQTDRCVQVLFDSFFCFFLLFLSKKFFFMSVYVLFQKQIIFEYQKKFFIFHIL